MPDGGEADLDTAVYVARVQAMFHQPSCVQGQFGTADERLAAGWLRAGVALETVRRAILLGSVRKSMTLIDRPGGEPVRALRYFESLLDEVLDDSRPTSYWRQLDFNLDRCEQYWRDRPATASGRVRPDLEQASLPGGGLEPSPATGQEHDGETG